MAVCLEDAFCEQWQRLLSYFDKQGLPISVPAELREGKAAFGFVCQILTDLPLDERKRLLAGGEPQRDQLQQEFYDGAPSMWKQHVNMVFAVLKDEEIQVMWQFAVYFAKLLVPHLKLDQDPDQEDDDDGPEPRRSTRIQKRGRGRPKGSKNKPKN